MASFVRFFFLPDKSISFFFADWNTKGEFAHLINIIQN